MIWVSIILTAVLCNANIQYPLNDSKTTKPVKYLKSDWEAEDILLKSLIDLLSENNGSEIINSINRTVLTDCLESYRIYKEIEKSKGFGEMNFERNYGPGDIDVTNDTNILSKMYDHFDEHTMGVLNEIIYAIKEAMGNDKEKQEHEIRNGEISSVMYKLKVNKIMELLKFRINGQQSYDISSPASSKKDIRTETPLLDFGEKAINITAQKNDDQETKEMYENRGAICLPIHGFSKTPIYVISNCLKVFASSNIGKLCKQMNPFSAKMLNDSTIDITRTPVHDQRGFVYRNMYCAQCNNVTVIQAWTTKIDCQHMQPLSLSDGEDTFTVMKEFSKSHMECVYKVSPAVPCMVLQCSQNDVISIVPRRAVRHIENKRYITPLSLPFTVLINFGVDGKTHIILPTTANVQFTFQACSKNEMYDHKIQKCRAFVCHDGYELVGEACKKMSNYYHKHDKHSYVRDTNERSKVTLAIKNVTYRGIRWSSPDIKHIVIKNLAVMFNISKTRIQNLTLSVVTVSESSNRTNSLVQTHRIATPLQYGLLLPPKKPKRLIHPNRTIDIKPSPQTENLATNWSNDPKRVKSGQNFHFDKSPRYKIYGSDCFSKNKGSRGMNHRKKVGRLTVNINFILTPAHKNRTRLEMSVKNVVQSMSDLINKRLFSLAIKGTSFKVQGFESRPQDTTNDFCKKGTRSTLSGIEFVITTESLNSAGENGSTAVIKVKETGEIFFPGEYFLFVKVESCVGNFNQTEISKFVIVCKMPKILDDNCGRIVLRREEYNLSENKHMEFENRAYNMSEYEYVTSQKDDIIICKPFNSSSQKIVYGFSIWTLPCDENFLKVLIAESYLTFVLEVISLICMLSVLITYGLFNKLRNLPGVNIMNFTFSLFMGELVFLTSRWIQPHQARLCSAVGMLLHYLFLAAFFWMNVMSFDLFKTFGNKCILTRVRKKKKYYPRYLLYAWGSPFLIVAFCGVLDYTVFIEGVKIGYGRHSVSNFMIHNVPKLNISSISANSSGIDINNIGCWIQHPLASMAAFGGPMLFVLLGNTVMFIRTVISIRASKRAVISSAPSLKGRITGLDDIKLYVKMSTFMGFTWAFGFASSIISGFAGSTSSTICIVLHLLGILFIAFNCSQGIFIFFAFIFNRKVLAMYKGFIERNKSKRSMPISVSSSRVTTTTRVRQPPLYHIS